MNNRPKKVNDRPGREKSAANPSFLTRPLALQDGERQKLLALLGATVAEDSSQRIIDRIERVLGAYLGFKQNVDEAPRAGTYEEEFRGVAKEAVALFERLASMNGYLSTQLEARFSSLDSLVADSELDDLISALLKLQGVATVLAQEYRGKDTGGAPKKEALTYTICGLRQIFVEAYRGLAGKRTKKGAFENRAPQEVAERAFVAGALRFGHVPFYEHELPRLFRDPRCIPRSRRHDAVEAIARSVSRARTASAKQKPTKK